MSSCESTRGRELLHVLDEFHRIVDSMSIAGDGHQELTEGSLSRVISDAAKLYGAACAVAGREVGIEARAITATQAIMLIHALMDAQNLNTFDLAVWQPPQPHRVAQERRVAEERRERR